RLRSQGNKGEADWSWIKRVKDAGVSIPVILNGNIKSPEDVKLALEVHEADAVMIGQGAINNLWIFKQSKQFLQTGHYDEPSVEEKTNTCISHLKLNAESKGEPKGIIEFRKFYSGYLRNLPNISKFRMELMALKTLDEVTLKLEEIKDHYSQMAINN